MKVRLGIDGSLRSSGLVALDENFELVKIEIIAPSAKDYNDEELIEYNGERYYEFVKTLAAGLEAEGNDFAEILYERASFGAKSGAKEKIAASYWYNRMCIKNLYKDGQKVPWPPTIVSVNSWRSKVLLKEDRERIKEEKLGKQGLKDLCIEKLPTEVREVFEEYCELQGLKKKAIEDLTDAYWLARYGFTVKFLR